MIVNGIELSDEFPIVIVFAQAFADILQYVFLCDFFELYGASLWNVWKTCLYLLTDFHGLVMSEQCLQAVREIVTAVGLCNEIEYRQTIFTGSEA